MPKAHKQFRKNIGSTKQVLQTLLDNHPDGIVRLDTQGRFLYINQSALEIAADTNVPSPIGKSVCELPLPGNPALMQPVSNALFDCIKTATANTIEFTWPNGNTSEIRHIPEFDKNGKVSSVLAISRNITELKRTEQLLKTKEREYRTLVENSPEFISRYDQNLKKIFVNDSLLELTGLTLAEALDPHFDWENIWIATLPYADYMKRVKQVMESGKPDKILLDWTRDNQYHAHEVFVVPEHSGDDNEIIGVLAIGRDVTWNKQIEKQLHHQAHYDELTGLFNRRSFNEQLHEQVEKACHEQQSLGLLFIDLDSFKMANDSIGHKAGDQILTNVAERILHCADENDIVARLAGDEFVVIVPNISNKPTLEKMASNIINVIAQPFHIDNHSIYVTACIGIAIFPQDTGDAEQLVVCADQAMYAAKSIGQNNYRCFSAEMLDTTKKQTFLANELHFALEKKQFEIYYQPIIDVISGQTVKAEALIRWQHPSLGMIPPEQFIPLAENSGLIEKIGAWVFSEVVLAAKSWNTQIKSQLPKQISFNMSPREFKKNSIDQQIIKHLQTHDYNPDHIAIEITEGLLLDDSLNTQEKLDALRNAGINISLDDFGTGYSAMAYLRKFTIDFLKIDRTFVNDLETDPDAQAIAEAIIMVAHRLGIKVIAEGVETVGQRDLLNTMHCEYMQGYLFAKPMPLDEFFTFTGSQ